MLLKEIFNAPQKINWLNNDEFTYGGSFFINNIKYRVDFDAVQEGSWEVRWYIVNTGENQKKIRNKEGIETQYGLSQTGGAFLLYATIIEAFKSFVKLHPNFAYVKFTPAVKEQARFYPKLLPSVAKEIKSIFGAYGSDKEDYFVINKKTNIKKIIDEIKEEYFSNPVYGVLRKLIIIK